MYALVILAAIVLSLLFVQPSTAPPTAQATDARPNILLIMTDDQRADFPELEAVMPTVAQYLGQEGVRFENAQVVSPLCAPSRASILTGLYSHNTDVWVNADGPSLDQDTTVEKALQDAGYLTGWAGKYMNQWELEDAPPHFDWYAIANHPGKSHIHTQWNENSELRDRTDTYSSRIVGSKARQFLRWADEDDDAPWFLVASFFEPHAQFTPEAEYAGLEVDTPDVFAEGTAANQLRMLMSVDDAIERIINHLSYLNEDNTLVIYVSDNGLHLGEYIYGGLAWKESNKKQTPYEPAVHVPIYARWYDGGENRLTDADGAGLVANIDIAPTILEAAGLSTDGLDGRSLLHPSTRSQLFMESRSPDWQSLLGDGWQFIEWETGYQYQGDVPPMSTLADDLAAVADCQGEACYLE